MSGIREALLRDILQAVKTLDEQYERHVAQRGPVLGLQVSPGFVLLLKHYALKIGRFSAEEYITQYDHFILLFPELLSIRAVRFSGEAEKISRDRSFLLEELRRKKERSRIELEGSFITKGKLSNVNASSLQILMPLLLALIRPLSKSSVILPSPLSLIAHELQKGGPRKVYLSPCTLTAVLARFERKENFWVLGNYLRGFLAHSRALTYRGSTGEVGEAPLKVFLPLHEPFDERFKEYPKKTAVVAHLLGLFVFEGGLPVLSPNGQGFFLALQESPLFLEAEALAVHGEPYCLRVPADLTSQRQVYRESGLASRERAHREYCYAICGEVGSVRKFMQSVSAKFLQLRRRGAHSAAEESALSDAVREGLVGLLRQEDGRYRLLAPPLIALAAGSDLGAGLRRVSEVWEKIKGLASSEVSEASLELLKLKNDSSAREVLKGLSGPWRDSFKLQRELARQHNMEYLL